MRNCIVILLGICLLFAGALTAQSGQELDSLLNRIQSSSVKDSNYVSNCLRAARLSLADPSDGKALQLAKEGLRVADSLGEPNKLASAQNVMGTAYKVSGMYEKSLEHYSLSMKIYEDLGNKAWVANLHSNIAGLFLNKGDYKQGKKELDLSLAIRSEIGYFQGISGLYNTYGNLYDMLGNPQKSLEYYQLALDSSQNEPLFNRSLYLGNLGNAYGRLHDFDRSRQYNKEALAIHEEMGWSMESSRDYSNIAECFFLEKKLDSAIHYAQIGYARASEVKYYNVMAITANILMNASKESGRNEMGLDWATKLVQAKDSVHKQEMAGKGTEMELSYKLEQQEMEAAFEKEAAIMQKDASIKRQTILNVSFGIGMLLLAGLGLLLSRRNKERMQANALLEQKVADRTLELQKTNEKLSTEVEAKENARQTLHTFLHRSSHDLKGPLSSIKGLLSLANEPEEQDKLLAHIAQKANQADGVLQQLIDKVEIDQHVSKPQLLSLDKLLDSLLLELGGRNGFMDIDWKRNFVPGIEIWADPMLLRIALRQVLANAIDFRANEGAMTEIEAHSDAAGSIWEIKVKDNGIGMATEQQAQAWEMFVRISKASTGAGLGLYLLRQIAEKEAWKAGLQSILGQGTIITLSSGTK